MVDLTHIDLFSGIGGFALACQWAEIKTEVFCENNERCQEFLSRTYPGVPIVPDVREFDGAKWRGRFLLTGGVPCQPASRAGKQRGKGDDRWLWPEAIRVIDEAKPRWCLLENPPGIYDVGFDGILDDLEGIGYEVGTVEIPACAVNSPQIRQRVWIVAHSTGNDDRRNPRSLCQADEQQAEERPKGWVPESSLPSQGDLADTQGRKDHSRRDGNMAEKAGGRESGNPPVGCGCESYMADTETSGWREESQEQGECGERNEERSNRPLHISPWDSYLWTPCADGKLRRTHDNSFGLVDGLHRSVLAALGNSIVPQVAYQIIKAIVEVEKEGGF